MMPWLDYQLPYSITDVTSKTSQQYGRQIYYIQQQQRQYWLKYQAQDGHPQYVQGFQQEQLIYNLAQMHQLTTLPCLVLHPDQLTAFDLKAGTALLIQHAEPILAHPPQHILHAKNIIKQMIQAVLAWHDSGWLHADLKPKHFVRHHNQIYLIDFEHAQAVDTVFEHLNATPHYMAPELFHHHAKTIQSDIYALGVIIYEWLSQQPLKAKSYREWAILHCQRSVFHLPLAYQQLQPLLDQMLQRQFKHRLAHLSLLKNL